MSAAANAAAFLSLRGRLHPNFVHTERRAAQQPPAVHPERPAPRAEARTEARTEARAEPRSVRVTYRRGRLAGTP